jgi:hypothetical protein
VQPVAVTQVAVTQVAVTPAAVGRTNSVVSACNS